MGADWRDDERVVRVLDGAELMFLAVAGRHGPHVTPMAFDRDGADLWAVTPRNSAKARAVDRNPRVGVLVRSQGRTVVAGGSAKLVDPLTGRGLSTLLRPDLPLTALNYLTRNGRRVVEALRENPSPALPLSRTALRISLDRVAVLGRERVRGCWGAWPSSGTLGTGAAASAVPDLAGVPEELQSLLAKDNPAAVLGWHTADGPIALPARWNADGTVSTPADTFILGGALPAAAACLTVDRSPQQLRSVRGLLITGTGRAGLHQEPGARAAIGLAPSRVTWWLGEDSGSVVLSGPAAEPAAPDEAALPSASLPPA